MWKCECIILYRYKGAKISLNKLPYKNPENMVLGGNIFIRLVTAKHFVRNNYHG